MKITDRDIELMGWILEQKFMTEEQVRQVFWKGITEKSRNAYKRMYELQKSGFLTTSDKSMYRNAVYCVTGKGVRELKAHNRNRGLGDIRDVGYTNYRHDSVVTDIRIMLYELGYKEWVSERVLSKRNDLRRVPDGMIYNKEQYIAVEYESTQKSKWRYKRIFLDYLFDRRVNQVLYIVDTQELIQKVSYEAKIYDKLYFTTLKDIQTEGLQTLLKNESQSRPLYEVLGKP